MKYQSVFLCVFLIVSLVATMWVQIPCVRAQEQASGNFGNPHISPMASMNWTRFWKLFNAHTAWNLEYNAGQGWISVKSDLQIIKNYSRLFIEGREYNLNKSEASDCKITLNFTASYNADYRLTFGIDLDVKNYTHKEGSWNYSINYQNHTVYFDWTDIKEIPNLIVTHGIKEVEGEKWFWFRIRRNNVPQGINVVIDPSFGYAQLSGSAMIIEDIIAGGNATCPEDCSVTEYHVGVKTNVAHEGDLINWTGSIYTGNASHAIDLVYQTPKQTFTTTDTTDANWINYSIPSENRPDLTGGNTYHLVFWSDTWGWASFQLCYTGISGSNTWEVDPADFTGATPHGNYSDGYDPIDDDITTTWENYRFSIYVNYTTDGVQEYEYNLTGTVQPSESMDYDAEKQFIHTEIVTILSYMQFQKEMVAELFALLETVKVYSVMDYSKEVSLEFFEFFENINPYTLLDYDFEVVTLAVDVTTFGTIAFVIAIIALAIGIVAFTRRS